MTPEAAAANFVSTLNSVFLFPLIALISAIAFLMFIIGLAEYFMGSASAQAREKGVKHITFGLIGLVIMFSAFAILTIVAATFSLDDELTCVNNGDPDCFVLPS